MRARLAAVVSGALIALTLFALIPPESASAETSTYSVAGQYIYTVPDGVAALMIDVYGAQGGAGNGGSGGLGGHVQATLAVSANQSFFLTVADPGQNFGTGGWPDGGDGTEDGYGSGGGGGRSVFADVHSTPLIVAGGGGGGGTTNGGGGSGGDGQAGTPTTALGSTPAGGGTNSTPGAGGTNPGSASGQAATADHGGDGCALPNIGQNGGGGGGGYLGGGGGACGPNESGGGGGGGGYTATGLTDITRDTGIQTGGGNISITTIPYAPQATTTTSSTTTSSTTTSSTTTTTTLPTRDITVIAPNGGESWARGSENTISWSFTGDPAGRTVKIELIRGSGFRSTLKSARAIGKGGHGSYSWTVSSVKPSTRYRVCITINDTASTDWSDAPFAIT